MLSPHEWRAIQLELFCILRNSTILWSFFFIYFLFGKMTCVHFGWIRRPVIKDIHCVLTVALLLHSIYCWNPRKRQLSCWFFLQTSQPLVSSATTSKTPLKLFFSLRRAILNTTPVKTDSPQKRLNGNENNRLSGTVCPHTVQERNTGIRQWDWYCREEVSCWVWIYQTERERRDTKRMTGRECARRGY